MRQAHTGKKVIILQNPCRIAPGTVLSKNMLCSVLHLFFVKVYTNHNPMHMYVHTYGLITSIIFFRMICIAIDQFCLSIKQSELFHAKMHVLPQLRQHNVCRYTDTVVLIKEESYMTASAAFWSKQQPGAIWDSSLEVRGRRTKKHTNYFLLLSSFPPVPLKQGILLTRQMTCVLVGGLIFSGFQLWYALTFL